LTEGGSFFLRERSEFVVVVQSKWFWQVM